ncbi:MAG TPA: folylpolyglutamate synthase/dihydrofolate synthase family protein [Aggregicoccus sp.]|nr:folylpolyglutamate synthase/dihydrofolate synthase family protein [Aggregicoccus sp.]
MALPRSPAEALALLEGLPPSTIRLGLERVQAVLAQLRHPERRYPALHVAGTNGKGSTCAFAAAALRAAGHRVGLYTSPHLVRFNERIQVDAEEISDAVLGQRILEVLERAPDAAGLTYFELATVVALWHFASEAVDVAVLETGLGGRLDATNTARPLVTAITPVALDHQSMLGDTVAAIAGEKAGILKPGVPVVCARQLPEALAVIEAQAARVGAPLLLEGRDFAVEAGQGGLHYRSPSGQLESLTLSLQGAHQHQNAAVALAALELLSQRGLGVSARAARAGLSRARWPGRLEELEGHLGGPAAGRQLTVLLDGAHNPAGVEVLLQALATQYAGRPVHAVFGVVADKDLAPMARALFPRLASLHLTPLATPRSLPPERYLDLARSLCGQVAAYPDPAAALQGAAARCAPTDVLLCTGSLFLVGAVSALLRPPRS